MKITKKTSLHMFRHTFTRKYLIDCGGYAFALRKTPRQSTHEMAKHYYALDIARQGEKTPD